MVPETLSEVERTILANQYKILATLANDEYEKERYNLKVEILEKGLEYEYHTIFDKLSTRTISGAVSEETFAVLDMFLHIKWALNKLTDDQISELDTEKLEFRGFDKSQPHFQYLAWWDKQNPDSHYIDTLGVIARRDPASQIPLAEYRGMLEVYKTFDLSGPSRLLTIKELQQLQDTKSVWPDKNSNL